MVEIYIIISLVVYFNDLDFLGIKNEGIVLEIFVSSVFNLFNLMIDFDNMFYVLYI